MAAGAACVASFVGPYQRFSIEHPGSILTVGSGANCYKSWASALGYLIENPEILKSMKENGRQLIIDKYNLENNVHLWPQSWLEIKNRCLAGICGEPDDKATVENRSHKILGRNDLCSCRKRQESKKMLWSLNMPDCYLLKFRNSTKPGLESITDTKMVFTCGGLTKENNNIFFSVHKKDTAKIFDLVTGCRYKLEDNMSDKVNYYYFSLKQLESKTVKDFIYVKLTVSFL